MPELGEAIGLFFITILAIYVFFKGPNKLDDDDWRTRQTW